MAWVLVSVMLVLATVLIAVGLKILRAPSPPAGSTAATVGAAPGIVEAGPTEPPEDVESIVKALSSREAEGMRLKARVLAEQWKELHEVESLFEEELRELERQEGKTAERRAESTGA